MARTTVIGVFDNIGAANEAVRELRTLAIPAENIGVLATRDAAGAGNASGLTDAEIGSGVVAGAGIGAVTGGLMGALNEAGVSGDEARAYEQDVRAGRVLVTVETDEATAERVRELLEHHGAAGGEATDVNEEEALAENPPEWLVRTEPTHDYRDPDEAGGAPQSADEQRREREEYGDKPWPRPQAYDIGDTLTDPPIVEAAIDSEQTQQSDRNIRRRAQIYRSLAGR
jgi:hypothetical protein